MNLFLVSTATSISEVHIPIINYIGGAWPLWHDSAEAGLTAPPGPSAEISSYHNLSWHQTQHSLTSVTPRIHFKWAHVYRILILSSHWAGWNLLKSFRRRTESTLLKTNTVSNYTKLAFTPDTVTHRGHICYCPWHVTLSVSAPWLTLVTSPSQPLSQPSHGPAQPHQGQGGLCPSTLSTLHSTLDISNKGGYSDPISTAQYINPFYCMLHVL